MRPVPTLLVLALTAPVGLLAQSLQDPIQVAHEDVRAATRQLMETRRRVEAERAPLVQRQAELQARVAEWRRETQSLQERQHETARERTARQQDLARLDESTHLLRHTLTDARRALESHMHPAERRQAEAAFRAFDAALQRGDTGLSSAATSLVNGVEETLVARRGGRVVDGSVSDAAGVIHRGQLALLGPLAYFRADRGSLQGIAALDPGGDLPVLMAFDLPEDRVNDLIEGRPAALPVDVTGGRALHLSSHKTPLTDVLKQGGVIMVPLALVALVALCLSVIKSLELVRWRTAPARGPGADPGPLVTPLQECAGRYGDAPPLQLEEVLHEQILSLLPRLERHLGTLAVLAGVAPLLGLLGTVTGMIHTFRLVTVFGAGNPRFLSAGISEALITTEVGLAIAIPTLLIHALLSHRVRTVVARLEQTAADLVLNAPSAKEGDHAV